LFQSHYKQLVPGHGPAVEGEQTGRAYFKRMYDYLEDFYGHLLEVKSGQKNADEVASHMLHSPYATLDKTRMVQRNINKFLTGRWYSMQLSLTQRKIAGLIRMIPEHLQNPPLSSFKKGGISCTQFIILRRSHDVTPLLKKGVRGDLDKDALKPLCST